MSNMVTKVIKLNSKPTVYNYLRTINGVLNLTNREIEALSLSITFDRGKAFTSPCREFVRKQMEITEGTLNNVIKSIKDKRVIIPVQAKRYFTYHDLLIVPDDLDNLKIEIRLETQ